MGTYKISVDPVPVREDRCLEPVARCLIRTLMVPKIYFEKSFPQIIVALLAGPKRTKRHVDIVAIDRAGTGDVHVVEIKNTLRAALNEGVNYIKTMPAHYKWVAYQGAGLMPEDHEAELELLSERPLLPESGMGRIGVIEVIRMADNILGANVKLNLGANIKLKAERFKIEKAGFENTVAAFVKRTKADIEFKG